MPQYGVLVYSPAPADPASMTAEYLDALERYPEEAKRAGGKILGASYFAAQRGFAFESSTTAMSVRGGTVAPGPFLESEQMVPAAFFVMSAPDMDVAVRVAQLHPATIDGGVDVRPLVPAPAK